MSKLGSVALAGCLPFDFVAELAVVGAEPDGVRAWDGAFDGLERAGEGCGSCGSDPGSKLTDFRALVGRDDAAECMMVDVRG